MFPLYTLIYALALSLLFPLEYLKRPKAQRKKWLREKLGYFNRTSPSPSLWVHAVSVGEVAASAGFVKRLKEKYPNLRFVVSTITDTGQKVAGERLGGIAEIVYLPFDLKFALRQAIKRTRPCLFITVETELWPNAFRVMRENGIPCAVVNGRLSEGSFKGYKTARFFIKSVLRHVTLFCMQDSVYAGRLIELGADKAAVKVTGNFKFDLTPPATESPLKGVIAPPVILAGSTHSGEEELIADCFMKLRGEFPSLSLIIAPRHPERFNEVEGLLKSKGLSPTQRSGVGGSAPNMAGGTAPISGAVVLLDTVGELFSAYAACDVAVIGGSFIRHGGQNPLEPAYWGKAVVCGPHMENFPFMEEFLREGGAIGTTRAGLYETLRELLASKDKREAVGVKAKEFCAKNTGAVQRTIKEIEGFLDGAV